MSAWGNYDNAANSPLWAVTQVNRTPNSTNRTRLFANTQSNAWVTTLGDGSKRLDNVTIGCFGVDAQESLATHAQHTGWTLRTVGSGGRAGRIQHEVLVAMSTIITDGDGQTYPNVTISLVTTGDKTVAANASFANVATFSVTPTLVGNTSASLSYQWQYNNSTGSFGWANIPANTSGIRFSGATTSTLYAIPANTANTTNRYRVVVTAADQGVVATSGNNIITIT